MEGLGGHDPELLRARRSHERQRQALRRRAVAGVVLVAVVAAIAAVALAGSGGGGKGQRPAPAAADRGGGGSAPDTGENGPPANALSAALRRLAKLGLPVYCGGHHGRDVALTFDDGPGPYTTLAMRKLRAVHARATWFLVARSISSYPHLARREVKLGAIGDHTVSHPFLPGLSQSAMAAELRGGKRAAERASGVSVRVFRPPYGARTTAIDREAKKLGMVEVIWSTDSADSLGANFAGIARNVKRGLRPGAIILMHENRGQTIRAMRTFLPALRRRHLRAVTVPELLAADPPSRAQLKAGPRGCR